jgi:hypothetical protein
VYRASNRARIEHLIAAGRYVLNLARVSSYGQVCCTRLRGAHLSQRCVPRGRPRSGAGLGPLRRHRELVDVRPSGCQRLAFFDVAYCL